MVGKLLLMPFLCVCSNLFASARDIPRRTCFAKRLTTQAIEIDGVLDDRAWTTAAWNGGFTQREPRDGAAPSQQTQFKVLYDDKYLYVGIRALDSEPDKIVKRVTRRDRFDGDLVEVNIDSYFDHRTAFSFTINAAGVRGDEAVSRDGDTWDASWNPVWFGEAAVDARGWCAEIKIPFSQLRYGNKPQQVWGFQVMRRIFREGEDSLWQYIPKNSGGYVSYFGELHGIQEIKPATRIEMLPYAVSDLRRSPAEAGNPFATGGETNFNGGADAKIGVTSDLTLDLTINPDFGQVEADPSEVNLSAFETFFPEKRPFFIEGKSILDYRLMGGDGSFANDRLFYSRRIGRSPQHDPDLADDEFALLPDNTSIMTAMKLTGKTKSGLSVGVLNAVTQREVAQLDLRGERRQETVEPLTNYFVGRLQKDYNDGNTALGGVFTATNRKLSQEHLKVLNRSAYSGGVDFRHQWHDKTYSLDIRTAFSHIRGDAAAILRAQTASQRYFQRPDADYVTLDSTRTSLSGHGGMVSIGRGGKNRLRLNAGMMWRSPGLELNDLGFLRQADRVLQWTWAGYSWDQPVGIFRSLRLNLNQWAGWHFGGERIFTGGNINGGGQFKNHWQLRFGVGREGNNLSTSALRGGPAMKFPGQWNQWLNLSTDNRTSLQFGFGSFTGWNDDGISTTQNVRFSVRYRPKDSMQLRVAPFYTFNKRDMQYLDTVDAGGEPRYLFGRLHQKTFGVTLRLDFSITPDLSIQYYGQPFISAGAYSDFKRITAPRDDHYDRRFHTFTGDETRVDAVSGEIFFDEDGNGGSDYSIGRPDFNFRQFRSNLIVRWEYDPGSTIFLVWTQERTASSDRGAFSLTEDFDTLFSEKATNIFLLKVSRWFSL